MSTLNIYPWQETAWQQLSDAHHKKRLPHAVLISGPSGLGKELFARTFAKSILCQDTECSAKPCGKCHACCLVQADSHPDLLCIAAEPPGQIIKVDQIRDVLQLVNKTAMQNSYRVIIIHQAHQMNYNAANSLLKSLEEPAPNTLFLLLSNRRQHLQPTILSRCQTIQITCPENRIGLEWIEQQLTDKITYAPDIKHVALKMAEGAPLRALQYLTDETMIFRQTVYQALIGLIEKKEDPLACAAKWYEQDAQLLFTILFFWIHDIIKILATQNQSDIINIDYHQPLLTLADKLNISSVFHYLEQVKTSYATILNSLNLNRQLLLEDLLIRWALLGR